MEAVSPVPITIGISRGFSIQPDPLRSLGACPNSLFINVKHGVSLPRLLNRQFVVVSQMHPDQSGE